MGAFCYTDNLCLAIIIEQSRSYYQRLELGNWFCAENKASKHLLVCKVESHTNKVSELAISTEIEFETSRSFAPKGYTALVHFGESIRIFHVDAR